MASTVVLKAAGLHTSPNQLSLPEGALTEASNVLIRRDGIIEQRRGFKLYGNSTGISTDRVKQLTVYRNRIIRHINDKLEYDSDGAGFFDSFTGSYSQASDLLRMKFIESNGNLYFTSTNGIQKIAAKTASTLSATKITKAGAPKAIGLSLSTPYVANLTTGFLPQDSAVAYRVVWGYKDVNTNLILGAPSQREIIYNYQLNLILQDYMRLLGALDSFSNSPLTTARINDKNYVSILKLQSSSSLSDVLGKLQLLCTKLDNDILYADTSTAPITITSCTIGGTGICTINTSGAFPSDYLTPGSFINLSGFTDVGGLLINGVQTVVNATTSYITFNTSATGAVIVSGSSISSHEFRSLTVPAEPLIPPVNGDNNNIQEYLSQIIATLRKFPDSVITAAVDQLILDKIDITTTTNVNVKISIPMDIDSKYFYQLYRSSIFIASTNVSLSDVTPNDELQLVYEAYPTSAELYAHELTFLDITPDDFKGANLYTNNSTGEGITQANEIPPYATDINRYRNVVFYANTRTKHSLLFNLLGVQAMLTDYDAGKIPSITISTASNSNTYTFITGLQQTTKITTIADVSDSLNGKYFLIDSTSNSYYIYFETTIATDPTISGRTGIKVKITTNDSDNTVALKLSNALSVYLSDFSTSITGHEVTVQNSGYGEVTNSVDVNSGFTFVITAGRGENASLNQVLLSRNVSPAIAVDETARSLVNVINQNSNETIYGFYLSGAFDVPGKMVLEARDLQIESEFFMLANNKNTGLAFNPAIVPLTSITSISAATNAVITTLDNHGLSNRDFVSIGGTNSTPNVNGVYEITYLSPNSFSIPINTTISGNAGSIISTVNSVTSSNEVKPNRVYYSKLYQPEAVPLTNYFNVGAEDKEILRIFPLRDSLFVFKEDGLYRISGDNAPFQLNLFDSSFSVTAPDSVTVINNIIFAWTNQGIQSLTEGGAQVVSRSIDNQILKLGSINYTNFKTATWGIGYESDNSYLVSTVTNFSDTIATKIFRFSTLTQSWTTYDKTNTCGIINNIDDTLYMGAGDTNYIEKERKVFDRTDFADREIASEFTNNFLVSPLIVKVNSVTGYSVGDVVLQDQTISAYEFNSLLEKIDMDDLIQDPTYYSTLKLIDGGNPRFNLLALSAKLDSNTNIVSNNFTSRIADYSGVITSNTATNITVITSVAHNLITGRVVEINNSNCFPSIDGRHTITVLSPDTFSIALSIKNPGSAGTWQTSGQDFTDLKVCYNDIVQKLNIDSGVFFSNYRLNTDNNINECSIISIDSIKKTLTLNIPLNWLVGDITIFKSIPTIVKYAPITMGDPLMLKHLRESTLMLETRNITSATMSFASDLLPELISVPFVMDGNGIFGHSNFGSGFFGGLSNSAPFRTFIPRQCQRCRFLVIKYEHDVAREDYRLLGISITGETGLSTRTYR